MHRLVRAIAHALQRLASLLLGLAGDREAFRQKRERADGSPPPDWLRRTQRDPPRDWLERVRRGRPRWIGGITPQPPAWPAPIVELDEVEGATPHPDAPQQGGKEIPEIRSTPTLPRKDGGRYRSTPQRDPLLQPGRASSASVGGQFVEAPTPHRNPPPHGGRETSARLGGQILEAQTPHPVPPSAGGREINPRGAREQFAWRAEEIAEADRPHPDASPHAGMVRLFKPDAPRRWERQETPHPDRPPQGVRETIRQRGRETIGQWGRERNAVYEIQELPFAGAPENPWPDLLADPPADAVDPVTLWHGWERRERLAREQRGD